MSSADVYTGGFGAEFGGRISSVMDIKTRDGNKKHISGKIDLSNIQSQVLLEGPLVKLKDDRKTSLSFILSGKGSYLDKSSRFFYPYVGDEGLPFGFLDLYGKITLATQNGTKLNLFGFRFDDKAPLLRAPWPIPTMTAVLTTSRPLPATVLWMVSPSISASITIWAKACSTWALKPWAITPATNIRHVTAPKSGWRTTPLICRCLPSSNTISATNCSSSPVSVCSITIRLARPLPSRAWPSSTTFSRTCV